MISMSSATFGEEAAHAVTEQPGGEVPEAEPSGHCGDDDCPATFLSRSANRGRCGTHESSLSAALTLLWSALGTCRRGTFRDSRRPLVSSVTCGYTGSYPTGLQSH